MKQGLYFREIPALKIKIRLSNATQNNAYSVEPIWIFVWIVLQDLFCCKVSAFHSVLRDILEMLEESNVDYASRELLIKVVQFARIIYHVTSATRGSI